MGKITRINDHQIRRKRQFYEFKVVTDFFFLWGQKDIHGLLSQIKDLERKNAELDNENKILTSKVSLSDLNLFVDEKEGCVLIVCSVLNICSISHTARAKES